MIDNYDNNDAMAKYGRQCAKYKAIREHKEAIRDICVGLQNANDADGVINLQGAMNEHINNLVQVMKL